MVGYFKLLRSSFYAMATFFVIAAFPVAQLPIEGLGALAQEEEEKKYKDVETRKRESVGKTCASALDKVIGEKGPIFKAQEFEDLAAQAESSNKNFEDAIKNAKTPEEKQLTVDQYKIEKVSVASIETYRRNSKSTWKDAEKALLNIDKRAKTCSSDYEKIQVWNYLAYTYFALDDYDEAVIYYEKIVNSPGEDDEFRLEIRRTLGQFYAQAERYQEAIIQLEIWSEKAFVVGANERLLMAQLYLVLERENGT